MRYVFKNYGYAFSVERAVQKIIQAQARGYGTIRAKRIRLKYFVRFVQVEGITDLEKVKFSDLQHFAQQIQQLMQENDWSPAYAQNIISDANRLLGFVRKQRAFRLSPSAYTGKRPWTRTAPPTGMELVGVLSCVEEMRNRGLQRCALIVLMARIFGMRLRETVLADIPRLYREAMRQGTINVQEGTKGGRKVERKIIIDAYGLEILNEAKDLCKATNSHCLIPPDQNYIMFIRREVARARTILKDHGIKGYHDLRSSYACERYQSITLAAAPVFAGGRGVSRNLDTAAREVISKELGHNRTEVLNAYIGARRPTEYQRQQELKERKMERREMQDLRAPITASSLAFLLARYFRGSKKERAVHVKRVCALVLPYCQAAHIQYLHQITLQAIEQMVHAHRLGRQLSEKTQKDYLFSMLRLVHALGHPEWEQELRNFCSLPKSTVAGRRLNFNRRQSRG